MSDDPTEEAQIDLILSLAGDLYPAIADHIEKAAREAGVPFAEVLHQVGTICQEDAGSYRAKEGRG